MSSCTTRGAFPLSRNSQQNTEEDMNPNKHIMVVCVFLSDNPAWGRRVCRLVGEYSIRSPAGWSVVQHPGKHNTHFPTEHHTEESQGGEEERRRRSISTTQHLQHSTCSARSQSVMCPPGPSQHKPESLLAISHYQKSLLAKVWQQKCPQQVR